jgi:metal-sulfur cluster biosynthetic enzyme
MREGVMQALGTVFDPELGLSVVELGLVYDVAIEDGRVRIVMTLTAPGCPIHDAMIEWVERAVRAVPGVEAVDVAITFDPPWTPDRMTPSPPR